MSESTTITTLPSGAKLEFQIPSFEISMALFQAVCHELKSVGIDLKGSASDLASMDITGLVGPILQVAGSKNVEHLLFECFKSSLYGNARITRATFEPATARGDFLPAAWAVMKGTLAPFFAGLDLSLLLAPRTEAVSQK